MPMGARLTNAGSEPPQVRPERRPGPRSLDRQAEPPGDQHPLHLGGALTDLEHLGVAVETRDRVLLHEAVAAEDLGRDPGGGDRRLGGVELGDRGGLLELLHRRATTLLHRVLHGRGPVGQQAARVEHHLEVGDLEGQPLLAPDRDTEGLPLPGVLQAQVETGLDAADRERGDGDPAVVEGGEELRVAAAPVTEQVGLGDVHAVEGQRVRVGGVPAELVVGLLGGEAGGAAGHDDRRDLRPLLAGGRARRDPGARGHRDQAGDLGAGVGDELLGAVDDPLAVDQLGPRLRRARVGARAGLGEAEAGQRVAGDQVGQPGVLLLLRAVGQDRVDAQADRGLEGDAHRLVDAADLLDRDAQAGEVAVLAGAAVLLGRGEAEEPEPAHLLHHVHREVVVAVPLRGVRGDLGLGELADAAAELFVLSGQLERHGDHASPTG